MASRPAPQDVRNRRVAIMAGAFALLMLGLGYAAVPLYRIFCEATGYGGTPRRVSEAQAAGVRGTGATMSVRFDANVATNMAWNFRPDQITQTVKLGQRQMATFYAKNLTARPITGTATFNIQPDSAARFFNKIQCFCFTQQRLMPGQEVHMPVIYYVDPAILDDKDNKGTEQITLSYTFNQVADDPSIGAGSTPKPLDRLAKQR
ncbi:cytochrome c oxidase assembly protein [Novosphingobium sp.]|uniref:cytochrome c oxidase assembly protein n=1 Tax=Novosphingobium sp. TaxID=1874826 RepID=UPI0025E23778|nr:cytochrome c oxidase assembly protein [Novosphingobium sp.]